jgi:hypothetical protein
MSKAAVDILRVVVTMLGLGGVWHTLGTPGWQPHPRFALFKQELG